MRTVTTEELKTILENHRKWQRGEEGGSCANLADADLSRAYLSGAYLYGAYLSGVRNSSVDLVAREDPDRPYVRRLPDVTELAKRAAAYRIANPTVPIVEQLDKKILQAITSGGGKLEMGSWHSCETTHCRAGWAIHLAGEAGKALEDEYGSQRAGWMIYRASTGRVPHFFATNERALEDIKQCAAQQTDSE